MTRPKIVEEETAQIVAIAIENEAGATDAAARLVERVTGVALLS